MHKPMVMRYFVKHKILIKYKNILEHSPLRLHNKSNQNLLLTELYLLLRKSSICTLKSKGIVEMMRRMLRKFE